MKKPSDKVNAVVYNRVSSIVSKNHPSLHNQEKAVSQYARQKGIATQQHAIIYCRVSSKGQADNSGGEQK